MFSFINYTLHNSTLLTVFVEEPIPQIDRTRRAWRTREDRGGVWRAIRRAGAVTTRILFKHAELFQSGAPGGSGHGPERTIRDNEGCESESLRFLPIGYNTWAEEVASRTSRWSSAVRSKAQWISRSAKRGA